MKTNHFTSTLSFLLFVIIVASCSSSKSSTKKYPYPGSPVPQERNPNDKGAEEGKNGNASNTGNLPPGQAKKIYGEKSAKVFAPGQQKKQNKPYPLIIIKTPDVVILRHVDGRYFYKNGDNMIYWKGNDDRFYLDEQYLEKVEYDRNELDDWKGKGNSAEKKSPPGQVKKEEEKEQKGKGNEKKKSKND